ncbi:histidine phosphatase family protein [Neobacillus sp. C211]|uniref:histidine phosphatase family protein n=1 Tax=unclassified Neobacillus TaxID=2675272 RepID=UPI0039793524
MLNNIKKIILERTILLTNLYFVRHAHSTYTPDELGRPLSNRGFSDVERITNILEKENIDIVISSPYKRAVQLIEFILFKIEKRRKNNEILYGI